MGIFDRGIAGCIPLLGVASLSFVTTNAAPTLPSVSGVPAETAEGPCGVRGLGSRWAPPAGTWVRTSTYGVDDDNWLMGVTGITTLPDGRVLVYDGRLPAVKVLSGGDLELYRAFGRRGEGPGEFAFSPFLSLLPTAGGARNLVTGSDSLVYVFDTRKIEIFDLEGTPHATITGVAHGFDPNFTIRYLHAHEGTLFAVNDSLDRTGVRPRRFQVWTVETQGSERKVVEIPLQEPPRVGGGTFVPARQAVPLWAASGPCAVLVDGEANRGLRVHLPDGSADTIRLPPHEIPPPEPDPILGEVRSALGARGGGVPPGTAVTPTSVMRWSDLSLDPDGYVWIRPWVAPGDRVPGEVPVFRVDPATGDWEEDLVPAFPRAFGPPGVFYAVEEHPETDEVLVTRYAVRRH